MFWPMMEKLLIIEQIFIESLLNENKKLYENLVPLLVLLESTQWVGSNEGDLEIFRPKVQKILIE